MLATNSVNEFLNEVASNSPAPGGGSVSALASALGAALTSMVCQLTIGKKKYEHLTEEMTNFHAASELLRAKLTDLIDQDTEAFKGVMKAFGMPKETEEQKSLRSAAIQEATKESTFVPLEVMRICERGLTLAKAVALRGNVNSISDAGVAALMLHAGCRGAALNVRINLATLKDEQFVGETTEEMTRILASADQESNDVLRHIDTVLG